MKTARLAIVTFAAAALLTACGGGNSTAVCQEAVKAFTDYSAAAGASAGDLDAINKATSDLAGQLKDLAAKADGDLQSSLSKMADTWAAFKIDPSNPAAVTEFATKASEATQELGLACA
ncbi:hypothetical protein [Acrocarpospora catenulata]|uniref:hypothetical protein n=1 Tax=Acrocarpospora catenulata TaxID=2836182 RepID=UPI001BD9157E|nr:hypothetical protein [Acrocarpospora catenulata]